nr:polysaccharide pyruvyl transferase family protein [uncultured Celeribacter sp.]
MSTRPTIAVENSTWNNIGDAFYQESLISAFRKAFPAANVVSMDGPSARAFRIGWVGSDPFEARMRTVADHYVFSGPIIGPNFMRLYAPQIEAIVRAGKSYSLISVRSGVNGEALDVVREFLRKHPPRAIYTRDPSSLVRLSGIVDQECSGPCFAFFVSKLNGIPDVSEDRPYLALSVYTSREPCLVSENNSQSIGKLSIDWRDPPKSRRWRVLRHLEWHSSLRMEQSVPFGIVRPVQSHSRLSHVTFARPNSYISYNPLCYLGIIKGCAAVISDRVHAGVSALSFGRAMHVRPLDERYDLFTDIPLQRVGEFQTLDTQFVDDKFEEAITWLQNIEF